MGLVSERSGRERLEAVRAFSGCSSFLKGCRRPTHTFISTSGRGRGSVLPGTRQGRLKTTVNLVEMCYSGKRIHRRYPFETRACF